MIHPGSECGPTTNAETLQPEARPFSALTCSKLHL